MAILKAGQRLDITASGPVINYDILINDAKYDGLSKSMSFGPYQKDVQYSLTINSGAVSYIKSSKLNGEIIEVTLASLGGASESAIGSKRYLNGCILESNGVSWEASYSAGSGLPFVMPSSGNVTSKSGDVTVTTAFNAIVGPSFSFFPQGALYVKSPAGWYYTNWTSTTAGKVYADKYLSGNTVVPASPSPITTVIGAYTQCTGYDVVGPNYVIPAGLLSNNGFIKWTRDINSYNSVGTKTFNTYLNYENFQGASQTTNPYEAGSGSLKNRGVPYRQVAGNAQNGDSGNASAIKKITADTDDVCVFCFSLQLAVATDYAIIESNTIHAIRGE